MHVLKLFWLALLLPLTSYSQNENQFLTSQKGIFIEQNDQGKYGIVNSKGDVLVPIENEYVKSLDFGGFIVYEKIEQRMDFKTGVMRYYNIDVKDVFNRTFTRIEDASQGQTDLASEFLICYDGDLCGVYNRNGKILAPIIFNDIRAIDINLFWFDVSPSYRGEIKTILNSKKLTVEKISSEFGKTPQKEGAIFNGLFDDHREVIGGENFRIVEIITYEGANSIFAVQDCSSYLSDRAGLARFAIMNSQGALISEYIYSKLRNVDGEIIGEIELESGTKSVYLQANGEVIK